MVDSYSQRVPSKGLHDLHAHISGSVSSKDLFDLMASNEGNQQYLERLTALTGSFFPDFANSILTSGYTDKLRQEFHEKFTYGEDKKRLDKGNSFVNILSRFPLINFVLENGDTRSAAAEKICYTAVSEGVSYIELRADPFSPVRAGTAKNPVDVIRQYVSGIKSAVDSTDGFEANLTLSIAKQHYVDTSGSPDQKRLSELENGLYTIAKTINRDDDLSRFVVGLDAVNREVLPLGYLKKSFDLMRDECGLVSVPHAGESPRSIEEGLENILSSIYDLGARRIGHALAAVVDPYNYIGKVDDFGVRYTEKRADRIYELQQLTLMEMVSSGVAVETNPTANLMVSDMKSLRDHPVDRFIRKGIPVVIGTDDKGIFGKSLAEEIYSISKAKDFSQETVSSLVENSKKYSIKSLTPGNR